MIISERVFPAFLFLILLIFFIISTLLARNSHSRVVYEEIELTRMPNGLFYMQASIGTPPQIFPSLIDTAASLSWVIDETCKSSHELRYDSKTSSTHCDVRQAVNKEYKSGEWIKALLSSDHFAFGSLMITSVIFGRVADTNVEKETSSLLGFSPRRYEGSVLDRIKMGGALRHHNFMWLNRSGRSKLVFGKPFSENVRFVNCIGQRWVVPCVLSIGRITVEVQALIDTACSHIFLPPDIYDRFELLDGILLNPLTGHLVASDLSSLPDIKVNLEGKTIVISPAGYASSHYGTINVAALTHQLNTPYTAILGLPFILSCREIIFDFARVQIAII
jgi:hypothetical protein